MAVVLAVVVLVAALLVVAVGVAGTSRADGGADRTDSDADVVVVESLAPGESRTVQLALTNTSAGPADLRLAPATGRSGLCDQLTTGGLTIDVGTGPVDYCAAAVVADEEQRGLGPLVASEVPPRATVTVVATLALTPDTVIREAPVSVEEGLTALWTAPLGGGAVAIEEIPLLVELASR